MTSRLIATALVFSLLAMGFSGTVAADHTLFTIKDNGSNISLGSDDSFTVSVVNSGGSYTWDYRSSNSSILKLISWDLWIRPNPLPGSSYLSNFTFEGSEKGTTTLTFIYWEYWVGNESIINSFILNVTSNVSRTTNTLLLISIFSIIIVVPSALIIRRMRKED